MDDIRQQHAVDLSNVGHVLSERKDGNHKNRGRAPGQSLQVCRDIPSGIVNSLDRVSEFLIVRTLLGPEGPTDCQILWASCRRGSDPTVKVKW